MSNSNRPTYLLLAYKYLSFFRIMPLNFIDTNRGVFGFNLIWLYDKIELFQRMIEGMKLLPWRKPHIDKIFSFEESYSALKYLQSGKSSGKIVIRI